ncbi:MAG: Superoxide dismutase (Fe) [Candidatus Campbellbacteria bacterium GW2011_GWD1_35_49]|nr:MAG: manganese/iron superoxide dismutase-like protein, superoxide dismutase, Fe-Mn family [Candidatus Campbellbacteria bacterium GW2011_OD1_34_28]KKP74549.1 MAG: Superoxide dismutase (Fe) [Candidatus Campbellbacteria bacterium GW2011_GWD2_35_24]KKP76548.1 MAG: Superoxide dismutase (Fe) [Candidatus Campbellbacteria bacterium GW2011_GWC1_35_31]KKP78587.1 MAG: Superoxide dismutase (Fe) [Candidatus Campbellbacteria bacterium GW2011_GWD1_35_49]HAP74446.1 superoxide dismutase [Candidatus Campbellb
MQKYEEKKFNLPKMEGISEKQIEEHLKLYSGYVKHTNLIREKIAELSEDKDSNAYLISELRRRFNFEFNGMRMHEYYFEQFEGGAKDLNEESNLAKVLAEKYGSLEKSIEHFAEVGKSRGIGWAVLVYDTQAKTPHIVWVGDHELGQLGGLPIIAVMDMWEHAFMVDYVPSEKGKYIDAFLKNINSEVLEKRYNDLGVRSKE